MKAEGFRALFDAMAHAFADVAQAMKYFCRACFGGDITTIGPRGLGQMRKYIRGAYRTKRAERKALRRIGRLLRAGL